MSRLHAGELLVTMMLPRTSTLHIFTLLYLAILVQQCHSLSALDAYSEIVKIVNSSPPAKGIPLPTSIPSPRSVEDKIAIVGAGPAGIHMAYLLKKKGFKNIVVYERSKRIGGKSLTVEYRDTLHEMGTCYSQPDYEENIVALAKEYQVWDPVDIPSANIYLDQFPASIEYKTYVFIEIMKILQTQNATEAGAALFKAMIYYCALHRQMFGKYEGEIMPQPHPDTMKELECTFEEFLKRNNLLVLKPIFVASHTMQGYGHIDEVSALYGLMWNTPNYVKGLAAKFLRLPQHGLNMIRGGFQNLWKTIVQRENINVIFTTDVTRVKRLTTGVILQLKTRRWYWNRLYHRYYDFLIWTPSLYAYQNRVDASWREKKIFKQLTPAWFTTTLFSSTYGNRGISPIDYWLSSVRNKLEHSLWAQRDSYGTLNDQYGEAYKNGSLPGGPDGKFIRSGVAYQYGKHKPRKMNQLKNIVRRSLQATGATNISIMQQKSWEYFPRFSPNDMSNLWKMIEMQGSRQTWFAGSSVCFESVKSVLEYNKLLVSRMQYDAATCVKSIFRYIAYKLQLHYAC